MAVRFKVTSEEARLISRIVERAVKLGKTMDVEIDVREMQMEITACHANGCKLDLKLLVEVGDGDFGHDVFGIRRHIDRNTGELRDCFLPRCSLPESQRA